MSHAFLTVVSFLVTVGVLVVIHELGHYAAARLMGVKILRFSVGFGKPLWTRRSGADGTEWVLAAVPLGGYVKMLDEREGDVAPAERPRAFNRKGVGARIFIVLAGPAANFALAVLIYWALFIAGMPGVKPIVGAAAADTPAAAAGIASGDTLVSIAGEPVYTWGDVRWTLMKEGVKRDVVPVEVRGESGVLATKRLDLSRLSNDDLEQDLLAKLGLAPFRPRTPALVGGVLPDSAAERAGLAQGDRVVAINGRPIATWFDFTAAVSASPGKPIDIDVERRGSRVRLRAIPEAVAAGGARIGRLGVEAPAELRREYDRMSTTVRYGPLAALGKSVQKVADLSAFSLQMLGRMVVGEVSWKNLSGPLTIADYAGQSAQLGWLAWLGFLALVSVSLGVLNLLPIPLLDGGHLVYYLAEIVKGSPVSERTMEIGQRLGLALLVCLTLFAFYNDINRLFTS
jgi:regulator of sigma E protease